MTLSEQTNAIILNTLNGVRHNPLSFSLPFLPGSHLSFHLIVFLVYFMSLLWPPWFARLAPFCSGRDLLVAPLFRLVAFLFVLFTWVCLATGASVHRRGRCIGVLLSLCYGSRFVFVLVCLSIDVTGALVLLIRLVLLVSFCCTPLLFSVLLSFRLTLVLRNLPLYCRVCAVLLLLVCLVPLFLCCPVVLVSSGYRWCRGLVVSCWFGAPRCACAGLGASRVACPPLLCFLPLPFLPPLPRV